MSARVARRRRRQWAINHTHLARLGRPIYRRKRLLTVADAIAAERRAAQRLAQIKRKS